jgi:hypothetical protein
MEETFYVNGIITIPVCFPIRCSTKEEALHTVSKMINRQKVSTIDGDIYTWDGNSYPIIASRFSIKWYDAATEKE